MYIADRIYFISADQDPFLYRYFTNGSGSRTMKRTQHWYIAYYCLLLVGDWCEADWSTQGMDKSQGYYPQGM